MAGSAWYQVHPAFGCRALTSSDAPQPALIGEEELAEFWRALDSEEQVAVEFRFFDRCIDRVVGGETSAQVRGFMVTLHDYEAVELDDRLGDVRDLLFTGTDESFEIVVDNEPRLIVGCGWQSTSAYLSPDDVEALPAWTPTDVESTRPPDTGMDRTEALRVAETRLDELRHLTWDEAIAHRHERREVPGASGAVYTVTDDFWWEAPILGRLRRHGDVGVQVMVHDGGLSMAFPIIVTFTITPDGRIREDGPNIEERTPGE